MESESPQSTIRTERPIPIPLSPVQRLVWEIGGETSPPPKNWPLSPDRLEEMNSKVLGLLSTFPDDTRRIVELRFGLDGGGYRSFKKVAEMIGISSDIVRRRVRLTGIDMFRKSRDITDYTPLPEESVAYTIAHLPILLGDLKEISDVSLEELSIATDWIKLVGWENEERRRTIADFLQEDGRPFIESLSPKQLEFVGKRLELVLKKAKEGKPLQRVINPKNAGVTELRLYSNDFMPEVNIPIQKLEEIGEQSIVWLGLPKTVQHPLQRAGIRIIGEVLGNSPDILETFVKDIGPKAMETLKESVAQYLKTKLGKQGTT